uniref:Uncharacterized protein n=1 Tax=Octopus bimaculoides TaxID=37653 RepID=A0A0L8FMS0_OCTBM
MALTNNVKTMYTARWLVDWNFNDEFHWLIRLISNISLGSVKGGGGVASVYLEGC